mgnify:CR=1 FL=1
MVVDNSTIAANKTANIVTTRVTSMGSLFQGQSSFNGNISHWDTAAVTNMDQMFQTAPAFNQDLSSWCVQTHFDTEPSGFKLNANILGQMIP